MCGISSRFDLSATYCDYASSTFATSSVGNSNITGNKRTVDYKNDEMPCPTENTQCTDRNGSTNNNGLFKDLLILFHFIFLPDQRYLSIQPDGALCAHECCCSQTMAVLSCCFQHLSRAHRGEYLHVLTVPVEGIIVHGTLVQQQGKCKHNVISKLAKEAN